jgi:hypothetical protein
LNIVPREPLHEDSNLFDGCAHATTAAKASSTNVEREFVLRQFAVEDCKLLKRLNLSVKDLQIYASADAGDEETRRSIAAISSPWLNVAVATTRWRCCLQNAGPLRARPMSGWICGSGWFISSAQVHAELSFPVLSLF